MILKYSPALLGSVEENTELLRSEFNQGWVMSGNYNETTRELRVYGKKGLNNRPCTGILVICREIWTWVVESMHQDNFEGKKLLGLGVAKRLSWKIGDNGQRMRLWRGMDFLAMVRSVRGVTREARCWVKGKEKITGSEMVRKVKNQGVERIILIETYGHQKAWQQ